MRMRQQMSTMQANLETLRTRVGQIADLRDAQDLREGQRTLTARLTEVEECSSVQTLREFKCRIMRLEAQVGGNHGGVLGEAIRFLHQSMKPPYVSLKMILRTSDSTMSTLEKSDGLISPWKV